MKRALENIERELEERLQELRSQGKLLEAQRLGAAHPLRSGNDARRWAFVPASKTIPVR